MLLFAGGSSAMTAGSVDIQAGFTTSGTAGEITLTTDTVSTGTIGSIELGGATSDVNTTALGPIRAHVVGGDVSFTGAGDGIILRSPNGLVCRLISINDSGVIVTTAVTCP
jgi:hypothetical protein